ncbi:MAG TPA: urea amidolyase associated protein UAAP1 [Baekduia sp.]|uniref:urea amidolyase associated protein UAAP1 n=1 Tax=Baekduia sp. TaxID=2600305 RepID=UPI002C812CEA|nr:urea amidolyase associated protein UAAP1 [Baekduia sp.]HMJ35121.1 urea amidolyase associated protein UAAP1 [Baekduia sp.]
MSGTSTAHGARDHARAMGGTVVETMPTLPASSWPAPPKGVAAADLTWAEVVGGGNYTNKVVARGTSIRLTDLAGDACAHVLLFNADQPWERLNVADTVKVPWQAYLGAGHPLLSDQGRVLATVLADSSGHHDALCGTSSRQRNEERYGDGEAQGPSPAGRELLLLGALKHGLGARDVPPSLSFFQGVRVGADGALAFTGSAGAGASVLLRAELPLVVLIANVPHPLDPRTAYLCTSLEVLAWRGAPTAPGDPLWTATPEGERAFRNTADYASARDIV